MISVGIDHWYRLKEYEPEESIYAELKLLGRQYRRVCETFSVNSL